MLKVGQTPRLSAPPLPVAAAPRVQAQVAQAGLTRTPGLDARAAQVAEGPSGLAGRGVFRRLRLDHLTSGKRFDVRCTQALERITGHALSLDGLTRMYEKALPSTGALAQARVRITGAVEKDHFAYTVTFVDNMQRRIATARRRLALNEDGSLELYRHGTWVDEDQRGRGFAAQILRQELGMLTALSSHPETRLTLWAGGARDPQRGGALQSVGVYVWAKAGFEAAPAPSTLASGGDKPRCEDDPGRAELSDVALMRRQLGRWLDAQVEAGTLTPEAAAEVKTRAATLAQPHDFAALTGGAEAFPIQVGEGPKAGALGKAFLLSAHAPRWEGALKVNQAGPAMARAEAWVTAALARGGAVEAQQAEAWQAALRSGDDAKLTEALLHIGRAGGAALIEPLLALKAARPDLEAAVKDALLKVRGRWTPPRPKVTYAAPGGRNQAFTLPPQFAELAKLAPAKLLVIAVSDPDHRRAQAALQQLADKHLDKAAPVVEEAASKLYARFAGDEDRWLLRQAAVQILGKLPQEAGIPALVEASRVEDDINVMISIQRVLDNAEHPAAVEPAEQLGQRIEAMKAEIEKALAEL